MPLVPVMPISFISPAGLPKKSRLARASPRRQSSVCTNGVPSSGGVSQSTAAAPRSIALGMKRWPSDSKPRTATKRSPGWVWRES